MSYFWKFVNEINLWKNCLWETPKSILRKDSLSTVEENGSVMLIWVLHSSFSSKIDAGWLTSESLLSSDILLLFFSK